jgi:hypothetical protein
MVHSTSVLANLTEHDDGGRARFAHPTPIVSPSGIGTLRL